MKDQAIEMITDGGSSTACKMCSYIRYKKIINYGDGNIPKQ